MPVNNEGEHNRDGQPGCEYKRNPRRYIAKYPNHSREDEQASQAELEVGHHGGIGRVNMKKNSAPNAVTVAIESPASDAPSVVAISVRRLN